MKYVLEYHSHDGNWVPLYQGMDAPRGEFKSFEDAQKHLLSSGRLGTPYRIRCGGAVTDGPATVMKDPCPPAQVLPLPANPKQRFGDKKLPVHLVPPALQLITALNMGDGAEKYGPYNWRQSKVEAMTYVGAIQRHLAAYLDGEDVDPESKRGATHLGAIAACVAILADAAMNGQLIDNRPPRGNAGAHIRKAAGVVIPEGVEP